MTNKFNDYVEQMRGKRLRPCDIASQFPELSSVEFTEVLDELERAGIIIDGVVALCENSYAAHEHIKDRDREFLDMYLGELSSLDKLEEQEQLRLLGIGDDESINRVTEANLHIVPRILMHYTDNMTADLLQEGNLAVARAVRAYGDEADGLSLSNFCALAVRNSIMTAFEEELEAHKRLADIKNKYNKAARSRDILKKQYGREPGAAEVALYSGLDVAFVKQVIEQLLADDGAKAERTSAPVYKHAGKIKRATSPRPVERKIQGGGNALSEDVSRRLSSLSDTEKNVITLLFGLGEDGVLTEEAAAKKLGIEKEELCSIKEQALQKLRDA